MIKKEAILSRLPDEEDKKIKTLNILGRNLQIIGKDADKRDPALQALLTQGKKLSAMAKRVLGQPEGKSRLKLKFLLSDVPSENWLMNWSASNQMMEVNMSAVRSASPKRLRLMLGFALGCSWFDSVLKSPQKMFWKKTIKRSKPPFQKIMKYLKFFSADQMGRARSSFAFGFLMHLEQLPAGLALHDFKRQIYELITLEPALQLQNLEVDPTNPLGLVMREDRHDIFESKVSDRLKNTTWTIGGQSRNWKQALDASGTSIVTNDMVAWLNDPNSQVQDGWIREDGTKITGKQIKYQTLDGTFKEKRNIRQNDFARDAQGKKISEPVTPNLLNARQFYRITGDAKDQVSITVSGNSGSMEVTVRAPNGSTLMNAQRSFRSGSSQYNAYFVIDKRMRGTGFGMKMTATQITAGLQMGQKKIGVSAALEGGWRVWNKFGFDTKDPVRYRQTTDQWWERCCQQKLYEMSEDETFPVFKAMLLEILRRGSLPTGESAMIGYVAPEGEEANEPPPWSPPPLPSDINADVKKILLFLHTSTGHSSLSQSTSRKYRELGLPTSGTNNQRMMDRWFRENTVSRQTQQALHDYFKSYGGQFQPPFRREWGYNDPSQQQNSPNAGRREEQMLETSHILQRTNIPIELLNNDALRTLLNSPEMEIHYRKADCMALYEFCIKENLAESALRQFKLHKSQQHLQDLMDVEGFSSWWADDNGGSWGGEIDLSKGSMSLAVVAHDLYRKKKAKVMGNLPRARVASADMLGAVKGEVDPDIFKQLKIYPAVEKVEGNFSAIDLVLIEQALRDAKFAEKEQEQAMMERVASRWLL